jgi:hypothetical protein
MDRCFACDKPITSKQHKVFCVDDQSPVVGSDCFRKIKKAKMAGYKPPKGGPSLYAEKPKPFWCCGGNDEDPQEHTQDCEDYGNPEWIKRVEDFEKKRSQNNPK